MKYLDEVEYIRRGGRGRNGRLPDKLEKVFFLRHEEDDTFAFLYTKDNNYIGYGKVCDIISVNGTPL